MKTEHLFYLAAFAALIFGTKSETGCTCGH